MQVGLLPFQNRALWSEPAKIDQKPAQLGLPAETNFAAGPSSLAAFAAVTRLSEVSIQSNITRASYRANGSLALQVSASSSVNQTVKEMAVDLVISADRLNLNWAKDAFKNGPVKLTLDYSLDQVQVENKLTTQTVTPLRPAEEIIQDLAQTLTRVLSRKGDKNIQVLFDEEAIRSLFSDPKMRKLTRELIGLITIINSLAQSKEKRDQYTIEVSGKGQPQTQVNASSTTQIESNRFHMQITILPPGEQEQTETPPQAAK